MRRKLIRFIKSKIITILLINFLLFKNISNINITKNMFCFCLGLALKSKQSDESKTSIYSLCASYFSRLIKAFEELCKHE